MEGEEGEWQWNEPEGEDQKEIASVGAATENDWRAVPSPKRTLGQYMPEVFTVDKPVEVCSVSEVKGWERIRVQVDSGAIDTVGPKEVAKAFEMKETVMSKKGVGFIAANGSGIKNFLERRRSSGTRSQE